MKWFTRASALAAACAILIGAPAAQAQYVGTSAPLFPTLIVPLFPNNHHIPFSGSAARSGSSAKSKGAASAAKVSTIATGTAQIDGNATMLATHFPADGRARMKQSYLRSFDVFKKLERKLNLADSDVANAVAAYIVGNYMVLHNVVVDDPEFLAVVGQVRGGLERNAGFARVAPAQRRKLYEQTAMVGMFMALAQLSLKSTPQQDNVLGNLRDSAKANLAIVLGDAASTLRIDGAGMHL